MRLLSCLRRSPARFQRGNRVDVSFRFADEFRALRADAQMSLQRGGLGVVERAQRIESGALADMRVVHRSPPSDPRVAGDLAQPQTDAALDRAERRVEFRGDLRVRLSVVERERSAARWSSGSLANALRTRSRSMGSPASSSWCSAGIAASRSSKRSRRLWRRRREIASLRTQTTKKLRTEPRSDEYAEGDRHNRAIASATQSCASSPLRRTLYATE